MNLATDINKLPRSSVALVNLVFVIVIAFGLRVALLNEIPLSLSLDEAVNGLDALLLFRNKWLTPFLQNNFGRETLFFYLESLALSFYGISFFSLRFASVLLGTLAVPLLYKVGQQLGIRSLVSSRQSPLQTVSLLAATGLAVSYWHIYFSRVALRAILLPPLLLGLVWCFWRGWFGKTQLSGEWNQQVEPREPQRRWLIVAGFLLGLTFYTYLAARVLPLLFLTFVAIDLNRNKAARKEKLISFLIFGLVATLLVIPLIFYFNRNPQAFSNRIQAIFLFTESPLLPTLIGNVRAVWQIHFLSGTWLGQWPALNLLSAVGFAIGLLACLYHLKKPALLFILLWWIIGIAPTLLSRQDWGATTTILRSVIAWPALFLISAIGLTTPIELIFKWIRNLGPFTPKSKHPRRWLIAPPLLLLLFGSITSGYNYFSVWATTYDQSSDQPTLVARYLNSQSKRLTLTPLRFYADPTVNFLLQSRYPTLANIDLDTIRALIRSDQRANAGQVSAAYLLPDQSTAEPAFVLLVPATNGPGRAYLLPPLARSQIETLSNQTRATAPIDTILDREHNPIARGYPLVANAPFLPHDSLLVQTIQANFNNEVLLTGHRVEPAIVKPGQTVTLLLNWQAQRLVDGSPDLFIHLFDVMHGQRHGQINVPLTGILFEAHRWPVGITVPDIHYFTLPTEAPDGVYRFELGLYYPSSLRRLPVAAQPADDKIILGKFHLQRQPPPLPQYPLHAQFGQSIALIGANLPAMTLRPGQTLTYTLYWQALGHVPQDYTVFTHLLDAEGNLQAQQDNMPQRGQYRTSWWDPGEVILDPYALPLPTDIKPGRYTLRVGLYQLETGRRLPLPNDVRDFVDLPGLITLVRAD